MPPRSRICGGRLGLIHRRKSPLNSKWLNGIDGCRGGWVIATSDADLNGVKFSLTSDLCSLFAETESVIAIDIPIGLSENQPRACDVAAREILGWPRRNSVFSPPSRRALNAKTLAEALHLNREALGIGISKQAFCIVPKIREVDKLMYPYRQEHIREAHEVTFARLNGTPMVYNKSR
jgi:predicted RNase H-like nuclease